MKLLSTDSGRVSENLKVIYQIGVSVKVHPGYNPDSQSNRLLRTQGSTGL